MILIFHQRKLDQIKEYKGHIMSNYRKMSVSIVLAISFLMAACGASGAVPKGVLATCDSIIRIFVDYSDGSASTGTGFVVQENKNVTYIVTNHHVAVADDPISVSILLNSDTVINASVVASDENRDLAVLKVSYPLGMKPLKLKNGTVEKGDAIFAIGFPGAADIFTNSIAMNREDSTITNGIISAIRNVKITEFGNEVEIIQISAPINHGNSGGPVLDQHGNVIGISTYSVSDSQGINGAISVNELINFLNENDISYASARDNYNIIAYVLPVIVGLTLLTILGVMVIKKRRGRRIVSIEENTMIGSNEDSEQTFEYGNDAINQEEEQKPIRKGFRGVSVVIATIFLVVFGVGSFMGFKQAEKHLGTTQYSRVDSLFMNAAAIFNKKLEKYVSGLDLLEIRQYDEAKEKFKTVSGYRDSDRLALECDYRKGQEQLSMGEYDAAEKTFSFLGDYSDSEEMVREVKYQKAINYALKEEYTSAIELLSELKNDNYKDSKQRWLEVRYLAAWKAYKTDDVAKTLDELQSLSDDGYDVPRTDFEDILAEMYNRAMEWYYSNDLDQVVQASSYFSKLSKKKYKDTATYDFMSREKMAFLDDLQSHVSKNETVVKLRTQRAQNIFVDANPVVWLIDYIGIADASKMIVGSNNYAAFFLDGEWESTDGKYYFTMDKETQDIKYNMPTISRDGTYKFDMGSFITYNNNKEYNDFEFYVIEENCIDVYCYATGKTIRLYRYQ